MRWLLLGAFLAAGGILMVVVLTDDQGGQHRPSLVRVDMTSSPSSNPDFATSKAQVREHGGYFLSGTADLPAGEVRLVLPRCRAGTVSHGYEFPDTPAGFDLHGLVRAGQSTVLMAVRNDAPLPVQVSIGMYCRAATTNG